MKLKGRFLEVGDTLLTGKGATSYLISSIDYNNRGEAVFYELSSYEPLQFIPFEPRSLAVVPSRPILCSLEDILRAFDDVHRFSILGLGAQKTSADRRLFLIEKSNLVNCGKSSII